jgi:NAD(P)-dependent dehydrogenase (short-subunit alcohol dehydrogenase family)
MPSLISNVHLEPYNADRLSPAHLRKDFAGKSVLVTGGGHGIGAEIARIFAEAGVASIILTGRSESALKKTSERLASSFPDTKVAHHVMDITSADAVNKAFSALSDSPDILINNAGYLPKPENFLKADLEGDWWQGQLINVLGTALVTQAFLRHRSLFGKKLPASVVTLNTFGAFSVRGPNLSAYVSSKAGLARLMESVAFDVPDNVARFITVNPGAVKTEMFDKSELGGLEGIPVVDIELAARVIAWANTQEAAFLNGRFIWAMWDVDELLSKKGQILEEDLLISALNGA